MTKTSKRQQKDKVVQSLRRKGGASSQVCGLDLLSDELKSAYESSGINLDAVVAPAGGKKAKAKGASGKTAIEPEPEPLSKSQQRKLKQVQLKQERRDNMSKVLDTLNAHQASDAALALLRPLHQRGHRETKKQRLRRELQMQRAGLALPGAAEGNGGTGGGELLRQRHVRGVSGGGSDSDDSEEPSSSDEDADRAAPGAVAAAQRPGAQANGGLPESDDDGSSSDGDSSSDDDEGSGGGAERAAKRQRVAAASAVAAPKPVDPLLQRKQQLEAARREASRIRQELGVVPDSTEDEETVAARRQAAAAAAEAAHFPHRVVDVRRPAAMTAARAALPITSMEADIMEAVAAHDVIVLCGETGCGKTTQVPQFLFEAGYGCRSFPEKAGAVGITQPRRVAAISTAERVAAEMGCEIGGTVGYQVRYDRSVASSTALKFMTDGILLRELQMDFTLSAYSAIIVDEAHERALNTDLLLGMLSRVVPLRRKMWREQEAARARGQQPTGRPLYPLKLIVMSATLRTSDFTENTRLFPTPPPVINVPARQYPVTVHFSRRTELHDYGSAAFRKVTRIHAELPPGGILVFLTGQREVEHLCRKLRAHYNRQARRQQQQAGRARGDGSGSDDEGQGGGDPMDELLDDGGGDLAAQYGVDRAEVAGERRRGPGEVDDGEDDYEAMNGDGSGDEDEEEVQVMGGDQFTPEEIAAAEKRFEEQYGLGLKPSRPGGSGAAVAAGGKGTDGEADGPAPVHVLPLYAMLPQARQAKVFQPPPAGHRLIIVATNVAETSLTIPGIRYVVDAGRSKQKLLEGQSGGQLARFEVRWVSQAAAAQRAGRAGRTGPGHCYRLYSSAFFVDTFPKHGPPEIVNTSLESVVLVMKSMGVDKVHNFPFPTPPEAEALLAAHRCLEALGALTPDKGTLTQIGKAMAAFPISPRHARMLLEVLKWQKQQQPDEGGGGAAAAAASGLAAPVARRAARALPYALALAAALSTESPFVHIDSLGREQDEDVAAAEEDDAGSDDDMEGSRRRKRGGGDGDGDSDGAGPGPGSAKAKAAAAAAAAARRRHAGSMQARFRQPHGDAMSALSALCAYEAAGETEDFCSLHFLHARNLREAADLHRQLLRVLTTNQMAATAAGPGHETAPALAAELAAEARRLGGAMLTAVQEAPPERVLTLLRRAMAAGWADQVARRVRPQEYLKQLAESRRKRHAVRYQPCALDEPVFLHPRSALHGAAPELMVFTQLLRTDKRPYMTGLTTVEAEWLTQSGTPLCKLSAPLADPPPFYQPPQQQQQQQGASKKSKKHGGAAAAGGGDGVLAWHEARYGKHEWPLPLVAAPHPDATERTAVFAAALLDGRALLAMAELRPLLVSPPSVLLRPELRGVARVGELIGALSRARVDSVAALAEAWRAKPTLLQAELSSWLGKAQQRSLVALWPKLAKEAAASAALPAKSAALEVTARA